MEKGQVVTIEDRIPKLKEKRKQKANRRFVFYILLFFLMLLVIVYFQSPLSHVRDVHVSGNIHIPEEDIIKLSGLNDETSYWKVSETEISKKVKKHIQIKEAEITKKWPNLVEIKVTEYNRTGYVYNDGKYFPLLESGKLLPGVKSGLPADAPLLVDWQHDETLQEMAAELHKLPDSVKNRISEIHLAPEEADPLHLQIFMNDGYEVSATIRTFAEKMAAYPSIVEELPEGTKGIIHLEVGSYFVPYGSPAETEGDEKNESDE